jgi:hypothetical protein
VDCTTNGIPDDPNNIVDLITDAHSPSNIYSANREQWYQKDACDLVSLITDLTRIAEMLPDDEKQASDDFLSAFFDDARCPESDIGDQDAIEIAGTDFGVPGYDLRLVRTANGYNVYDNTNSQPIILAQLNEDGEIIEGDLSFVDGRNDTNQVLTAIKTSIDYQNLNGIITDPREYMVGFYEALNNNRIEDALELYKLKDINTALSMMGLNNNDFSNFCTDKSNTNLNTIFRQLFEDMKIINNCDINTDLTFTNWFDADTLACVEAEVNSQDNATLNNMITKVTRAYEEEHDREEPTSNSWLDKIF